MLLTALALLAGSMSILRLPELPDPDMFALAIPFTPLLLLLSRYRWLAAFVIGCLLAVIAADARLADRWPLARDGDVVSFSGCIDGVVERDGNFQRFEFRPDDPSMPTLMRLAYYAAEPALQPAECRFVTAKLRTPRGFMNPYGFDYEAWLFRRGIGATGYLRDAGDVVRHETAPINRLRQAIAERLRSIVDRPVAGLLVALAVGERFAIAPDHWNTLRDTGTAHLLAISGLHVGLVAGLAWWLCGVSRRPQVWRWLPGLALAAAYALLAGFSLSVQRALLMLAVVVAYRLLQRRLHWGQALGVALCLVLLLDPLAVLDAGFWLSFGAVSAILLLVANRREATRWLASLRLQTGLSVLLVPLVLSQFGLLPLGSIPANLMMIPLFAVAIVPAVLLGLVLLPSGLAVTWFGSLARLLEWLVVMLDSLLAWLPSLAPHADATLLALAVPGLVLLSLPVPMRFRCLGLLPLLPSLLLVPQRPLLGIAMLDVGQGQAIIVHSATMALVYDTGPRIGKTDAASWVVLPYLRGKGLIPDTIIASHGDSDHAGGVETLERAFPLAELIAAHRGRPCNAGTSWERDGWKYEFLHPVGRRSGSDNNSSCVLRISGFGTAVLLTGDIESEAEAALLARNGPLAADIVSLPHHGSLSSSTPGLVAAVSPRIAVASAGFGNRWNFPRDEVVARWEHAGAQVEVTGESGAILLEYDGRDWHVRRSREQHPALWRSAGASVR